MRVIENTLNCHVETWNDPGPVVAGGMIQATPHDYVEEVDGRLVIELDPEDLCDPDDRDEVREKAIELAMELSGEGELDVEGANIRVTGWFIQSIEGRRITMLVDDWEEK